jgi:hypothetical protein
MVNDHGQLYTIEGIAAGMIMLFTAYLVIGATSVYTPGDSHISDMQLEQTGTDALQMMNTPVNGTTVNGLTVSPLQDIVDGLSPNSITPISAAPDPYDPTSSFNAMFPFYLNNETGVTGSDMDNLHYTAYVTYYNITGTTTGSLLLASNRNLTGVEHPVRVTQWVITDRPVPGDITLTSPRAVLVEVLLWRD